MTCARMAELADAPDSKSGSRKRVGVRPSLRAPSATSILPFEPVPWQENPPRPPGKHDNGGIDPIDMSRSVAYIPTPSIMKFLKSFVESCRNHVVRLFSISLTHKEAAHA